MKCLQTLLLWGLITPLVVLGQTNPQEPSWLRDGLVGYYPFNGNSLDESGEGNNLTNYNAILSTNRFGSPNSSYYFNVTNLSGLVSSETTTLPIGTTNRTISVWVKPDFQIGGENLRQLPIVDFWNQFTPDYLGGQSELSVTLDGNWLLLDGLGGPYKFLGPVSGSSTERLDGWIHLTIVFSNNKWVLYLNGLMKIWNDYPPLGFLWNTQDAKLYVGSSVGRYYDGEIDDVRIYNRALSDTEVQSLYTYESIPPTDSDGDGLNDLLEEDLGTDPTNPDSDEDGLSDGHEVLDLGTNPLSKDSDNDTYTDLQEVTNGSDPNSETSSPEIMEVFVSIELNFGTIQGFNYQLEQSPDLITWTTYGDVFPGTGGRSQHFVSTKSTEHTYFRLTRVN